MPASPRKRAKDTSSTSKGSSKRSSKKERTASGRVRAAAKTSKRPSGRVKTTTSGRSASGRVKSAATGKTSGRKKARAADDAGRKKRKTASSAEPKKKKKKAKKSSLSGTDQTHRFTKRDLLSDSDLDLQLLESGSGELAVDTPKLADSDHLLLPEDEPGEVDIVMESSKKKKKSGRVSSKKASASGKKTPSSSRSKRGGASRRRAAPAKSGPSPMMFISLGLGLVIVGLIVLIVVKKMTVREAEDHRSELEQAQTLYEEAKGLYHDVGQTTNKAKKDQLRAEALRKVKDAVGIFNRLQEDPTYSVEVEPGYWEWKEDYSGLEAMHADAITLMGTLGKDTSM